MDSLTSTNEKTIVSSLLSTSAEVIYNNYNVLLTHYTEKKFANAMILLPLVCSVEGYKVELPVITLDNKINLSMDNTANCRRLVNVSALQIYLLTRREVIDTEVLRAVLIHFVTSHSHNIEHGLNVNDYSAYPRIADLIRKLNSNPQELYTRLSTLLTNLLKSI